MWNKRNPPSSKQTTGIDISVEELIALRHAVINNSIKWNKLKSATLAGHHFKKMRGRGIEFETTREYQPGDDTRRMAWRVAARSLKPHIKIYQEEKEQSIWLALDLSPSMYFGTRKMFKSVRGIKQAAVLGWQHLYRHARIGAIINTPEKQFIYSPHSQERHFLTILKTLSTCSSQHPHFTQNNQLYDLLLAMPLQLRAGHFLFIISDFLNFDLSHQQIIAHCAQRTNVQLIFVYDPFEAHAPPANLYSFTDGQLTLSLDTNQTQIRNHYQEQFNQKLNELTQFSHQHHLALHMIRTDQA